MEVEEPDAVPPHPAERFGLRLRAERRDPLQMVHAADEQDPFMAVGELPQAEGHPLFPAQVLPVGGEIPAGSRVFPVVGGQPDALHRIGIGERLVMEGIVVQVDVDEVEGKLPFPGQPRRFHQGVGRLDDQIDRSGLAEPYVIGEDGYLREPFDAAQERRFQGGGEFDGDAVRV